MIAVLTGDIIHSEKQTSQDWLKLLNEELALSGQFPKDWDVYRGDEFQLLLKDPSKALETAIKLKARIKIKEGLDIRIAIGLGELSFEAEKVTQSNGSAFIHSGRKFDELKKKKVNLVFSSDKPDFDKEMNLLIQWALTVMDNWSAVSSEIVYLFLCKPELSQLEAARELNIQQSAVSQRLKRAEFPLILELIAFYQEKIKQL